ncbi:hypothetical protein F5H01DRAFT_358832 [Linnemannia elongata]|nr:hypothetical protein F5H01DRAFT_358832 [Linnemannia elongata]
MDVAAVVSLVMTACASLRSLVAETAVKIQSVLGDTMERRLVAVMGVASFYMTNAKLLGCTRPYSITLGCYTSRRPRYSKPTHLFQPRLHFATLLP